MTEKKTNKKKIQESKSDIYTKAAIDEVEKKNLQDFYSSVLGSNSEESKANSKILRNKIYRFGFVVILVACVFYFFVIGKISFVTS
ncbi:MAG: hypothetical protein ACJZ8I_02425 [Paracoccaceae bacterium]